MMGNWPFQALTLDSKKICKVSKCREPGDITDPTMVDITLNNLKLAFHIRWPKYWSFSFSISPSNEYSGWISFRMDWLDFH